MKKIFIATMLTMALATNAQVMKIYKDSVLVAEYTPSGANKVTFEEMHEYVDLGLPSGTLWAICNVGAENPADYGDLFWWNSTQGSNGKADFSWSTEGSEWRVPTSAELGELKDNCTWTWTVVNGTNGYLVSSNVNSNSIFLPAAGNRSESGLFNVGSKGAYWSNSLYKDTSDSSYRYVNFLYFDSTSHSIGSTKWYISSAMSVRPVRCSVSE